MTVSQSREAGINHRARKHLRRGTNLWPSPAPIREAVRRPCLPTASAETRDGNPGPVPSGRPSGPGRPGAAAGWATISR